MINSNLHVKKYLYTLPLFGIFSFTLQAAIPIINCSDLQRIQYNLAGDYELDADIDCEGVDFFPIGSTATPFVGKLNGKGHIVSNLIINKKDLPTVGLFGATYKQAKIQSLIIENAEITGGNFVGGLIGTASNTTVSDIKFQGNVSGIEHIGGIIGNGVGAVTINNSSSKGEINGRSFVGGLVGMIWGNVNNSHSTAKVTARQLAGGAIGRIMGIVNNCYATGDVSSQAYGGGLIGNTSSGSIHHSYATGKVSGGEFLGGLVGAANSTVNDSYATGNVTGRSNLGGLIGDSGASISNSFALGNITGVTNVGGLVGNVSGSSKTKIINSYANGNIIGKSSVGGLIGFDSNIEIANCYASGNVRAEMLSGGLIGNGYFPTVTNSYWDIQTSEQSTSIGGEGKTTTEMLEKNSYIEWDFIKIWSIQEGKKYPILR